MYGLLLENLAEYVKVNYGEDKWEDIRRQAGIDSPSFSVHQVYPENLLNKLAKKAQEVRKRLFLNFYFHFANIIFILLMLYRYWEFPSTSSWTKWACALSALSASTDTIGYCPCWADTCVTFSMVWTICMST